MSLHRGWFVIVIDTTLNTYNDVIKAIDYKTISCKIYKNLETKNRAGHYISVCLSFPNAVPISDQNVVFLRDGAILINRIYQSPHPAGDRIDGVGDIEYSLIEVTRRLTSKQYKKYKKMSDGQVFRLFTSAYKDVNALLTLLAISTGVPKTKPIEYDDILGKPSLVLYRVPTQDEDPVIERIREINIEPYWKKLLAYQGVYTSDIINYSASLVDSFNNNPFKPSFSMMIKSLRLMMESDFDGSIIIAHTAFEIYIRDIVEIYYKSTNLKTKIEIKKLKKCRFGSLVNDHILSKIIKSDSDIYDAISRYLSGPAQYRNDIVHEGLSKGSSQSAETVLNLRYIMILFKNIDVDDLVGKHDSFIEGLKKHHAPLDNMVLSAELDYINIKNLLFPSEQI